MRGKYTQGSWIFKYLLLTGPFTFGRSQFQIAPSRMKSFLPILLRTVLVFAVACGIQYFIPWYILAPVGVLAGVFMLKTSDDRPSALGMLIGSITFGVFAYTMAQIFPVAG